MRCGARNSFGAASGVNGITIIQINEKKIVKPLKIKQKIEKYKMKIVSRIYFVFVGSQRTSR